VNAARRLKAGEALIDLQANAAGTAVGFHGRSGKRGFESLRKILERQTEP
jgi:hypothetical protein